MGLTNRTKFEYSLDGSSYTEIATFDDITIPEFSATFEEHEDNSTESLCKTSRKNGEAWSEASVKLLPTDATEIELINSTLRTQTAKYKITTREGATAAFDGEVSKYKVNGNKNTTHSIELSIKPKSDVTITTS